MRLDQLHRIRLAPYREGCGPAFILTTWSTERTDRRGQTILAYDFREEGANDPIFEGEDFAGSPCDADDSPEAAAALLGFLTLRPGDTDPEYFEDYTPEQLAYCDEHAETLAVYPYDVEDGQNPNWENLMMEDD